MIHGTHVPIELAGVMVTIPALIFFVAIQRDLIAGWGAGGMRMQGPAILP